MLDNEKNVLWSPSDNRIEKCNLTRFQRHPRVQKFVDPKADYQALHDWSCRDLDEFWLAVAEFCDIRFGQPPKCVLSGEADISKTKWFAGATLNYAENLLRFTGPETALISILEDGRRSQLSWDSLHKQTAAIANFFLDQGLRPGQRVVAILPNAFEAVISMLAVTSIGAVWSSCSPDFGASGVLDRFKQIEPTWLISCNGYQYNGKRIDSTPMVRDVVNALPELEGVINVEVLTELLPPLYEKKTYNFKEIVDAHQGRELVFSHQPFDHPLVIAYSSGTTGLPKPIIHRAGGVLLQHFKEHQLHADLQPGDRFFFFTTCGWMMWNWLVTGLASGVTLVLYDGSPFAREGNVLLDMIEAESIRIFGVGAKYLQALQKRGISPKKNRDFSSLDTILSTGSPLNDESYDFVYDHFKSDIHLASISGGTDILSCFVGGVPTLPVRRGEIQAPGLGMDVQVWSSAGKRVFDEQGELVCCSPFPTVPLGFWGDDSGERFRNTYFSEFKGVWCQSDFSIQFRHAGIKILGRSDSVLNPGGVRIGTAEIYRQVETVAEIADSVVVGLPFGDDVSIVLFVVMCDNAVFSDELNKKIRAIIRERTTPRHVPKLIIEVPDIPRTLSGKIAEKAVLNSLQGKAVTNSDALANPDSLLFYEAQRYLINDELSSS